ncbi:MAG TPA: class I adenylate-forming enzyme family protein [Polyangiales bacterium]
MSIAQAESLLTAAGARFEVEERDVLGVRMRVWKNGPHTLRDIFVGALLPSGAVRAPAAASEPSSVFHDRTLLVYEDERVSFAAFQRAVLALAQRFQQEGLQKGERVAIAMRNLPEWPVVYFAAALCGAIVTPLNAWWTGHELAYGLSDSETAVAIVDGERYERIVAHLPSCPSLRRVYVTRGDGSHAAPLAAALEDVLGVPNEWHKLPVFPLPAVEIAAEDPASIFYTSGTTGKPKGALATHRNVATNVVTQSFALARVLLRRGEAPPTPSPNDPQRVALLAVPFFHVTGCNATLLPAVWNGGKVVLMRKWDAELAMQLIERERVTTAGGVPTIAWQLLEHPARPKYDLSSLVTLGYGGAPAASELVRRIQSVFPAANPGNSWGMTETSGTFSSNYAEDYQQRPGSCGIPTATGDFKILSPDTMQPLAAGTVGELWARGPQVIRSYWKKPEASAETFVDGWVRTGDLAYLDEDGFCFVVDRAKDILIRGGENIYCVQVESALYEHPAVMDAAVLGIPHRTLGEEPGAVVYLKPGSSADETELRAFVAERLAAFEVPVRVLFWNEPLPRNPSGKILKRELKAAFTS